jgi:hypothetical protein
VSKLVRVRDGSQLWGEQFHREFGEIIRIQEEITSAISKRMSNRNKPVGAEIRYPGTHNPASYKAYLMGTYLLGKRTVKSVRKAIECFADSASHDPKNMLAHVKSVDAYKFLYVIDAISHESALAKIRPFLSLLSRTESGERRYTVAVW